MQLLRNGRWLLACDRTRPRGRNQTSRRFGAGCPHRADDEVGETSQQRASTKWRVREHKYHQKAPRNKETGNGDCQWRKTAANNIGTAVPVYARPLPSFALPSNKSALCNGSGLADQSEKDCPACSLQLTCSGGGDEVGSSSLGFIN